MSCLLHTMLQAHLINGCARAPCGSSPPARQHSSPVLHIPDLDRGVVKAGVGSSVGNVSTSWSQRCSGGNTSASSHRVARPQASPDPGSVLPTLRPPALKATASRNRSSPHLAASAEASLWLGSVSARHAAPNHGKQPVSKTVPHLGTSTEASLYPGSMPGKHGLPVRILPLAHKGDLCSQHPGQQVVAHRRALCELLLVAPHQKVAPDPSLSAGHGHSSAVGALQAPAGDLQRGRLPQLRSGQAFAL